MYRLLAIPFSFFLAMNAIAQPAPDFTVTDVNGTVYHLYDDYLNQGKTLVIEFFFTTCPPCNAIAPYIPPLYESWGSGQGDVEFMAISVLDTDSNQDAADYQVSHGHDFPGIGADGGALDVVQTYMSGTWGPFEGTPTFVVIEPDGTVHFDVSGSGYQGTIDAVNAAIVATGARRPYTISVFAHTPDNDTISGYEVLLNDESIGRATLDTAGRFNTTVFLDADSTYTLTLKKDTLYNNGLSTFDIIRMSKHILFVDTLEAPYQLLAADVNASGGISTFDIIKNRKLILGVDTVLTTNHSWNFVREGYLFQTPENPFAEFYEGSPQKYTFVPSDIPNFNFIGIKTGDVNGSAGPD